MEGDDAQRKLVDRIVDGSTRGGQVRLIGERLANCRHLVTDFAGGGNFITSGQTVAGPPGVHREALEVLSRYPALAAPRVAKPA